MKNRYKKHAQKREPKYENSLKKCSKNGAKIHQKSLHKSIKKRDEKKRFKPLPGGRGGIPKPNHFKRHPSECGAKKTHEEIRMKGECRVECKKWSAKGKCRKASADRVQKASAERQVQTGNPLRT